MPNYKFMSYNISGIQQLGVGVANVKEAFTWYRQKFGIDIPILDEASEANLMLPYTGQKPHQRHAILAISGKGGGGLEIWQYTSRVPQPPAFEPQLSDLGILMGKIKTDNIKQGYSFLNEKGVGLLSAINENPLKQKHFYMRTFTEISLKLLKTQRYLAKAIMPPGGYQGL